ncbi:amidohydrolase family protein [Flagellimonas profundi]|uniref:Amidohydrolase family protein n=1 Tax=Flagellimonas profundi TaxID=2915620 RepID=A0ABS3FKR9_9FLAO|nr:amidohydrolase family protein [Allomuricauda profundi]MBO0343492.1 amidohydrolase family protein [Allomuricauda profundi]
MRQYYCTFFMLLFASFLSGQQAKTYIKAGLFYDSEQNEFLENKLIVVENGLIVEVSDANKANTDGHRWIDLSAYVVLPGLIDAHTHVLFSQSPKDDFAEHSVITLTMESEALRVLRGSKRARSYLDVGITSIKDLGNSGLYLDVALRDAIEEGTVIGPRIFASGPILSAPGGQIYGVEPKHQDLISGEYRIIRGVEDAKIAVQEHVNQGVDLIKICADNLPNETVLSLEEMQAIVRTAHGYGLKVTAHAVTDESAQKAIEAGVDGIEHGFNISDSTLNMMAKKDVYLVPTENSREYMELFSELAGYDFGSDQWIDRYREAMTERLQKAIKIGVTIVAGSDNYNELNVSRGSSSIDMFKAYFDSGMTPLDILQSATILSATHLGKQNEIGVLKKGAKADIIALKGNVLTEFYPTIKRVVFVMKDGKIVKSAD